MCSLGVLTALLPQDYVAVPLGGSGIRGCSHWMQTAVFPAHGFWVTADFINRSWNSHPTMGLESNLMDFFLFPSGGFIALLKATRAVFRVRFPDPHWPVSPLS